jgi:hypothetical protein
MITTPYIIAADKTRYIELLDKSYEYHYMFLRPRRWGKSTFLQTLAKYYDIAAKDDFSNIFGDLYIGKNPTPYRNTLLVLVFDFSSISVLSTRALVRENFNSDINAALKDFLKRNAGFLRQPNIADLIEDRASRSLANVLVCPVSEQLVFV